MGELEEWKGTAEKREYASASQLRTSAVGSYKLCTLRHVVGAAEAREPRKWHPM